MSSFLEDILEEPQALMGSLEYTAGQGEGELSRAARIVKNAKTVYITGIGSSWHAGMAVQSLFAAAGWPVILVDASELLYFTRFVPGSCLIVLSRSGKSIEIVKLMDKADGSNVPVIAVTNTEQSPLASRAEAVLPLRARFDLNVSVTMYSALTLVGGLLASATIGHSIATILPMLCRGLAEAEKLLPKWQKTCRESAWIQSNLPTYFLARGASVASCSETRLLWEEAAKSAATALTTGSFRHGPQEILVGSARIGMWLSPTVLRDEDLRLVKDIRRAGAPLMLIGHDLPDEAADLVLPVPHLPEEISDWQFLLDIIPAQLAAAEFARHRGADCDRFAICPYVIEAEGGLIGAGANRET